ncbi:chemotaxis protein CheA [Sandaracinus amylolyticus]|uniref:chemotaxis protein CheA n=1 Tax=Sandaracinus amylolyticus TaxID=927083 RepID=UPI001F0001BD|nr:chemotaxis protein CheW [Sandaracinus amylolyticus]UJR80058.1 Signal transduction histidine kinase CheA [Sandaracinus amylolyticus]
MSRVDLREFLDAYLDEVDEHLANANTQLLALDAALRAGEPTLRAVRELFRALHTIKGLSAMVGVDPIVAIAHRMEASLRAADRAGGQLPEGAIDVMLQAVAAIEQRVRALASGHPVPAPPGPLLAALDTLDEVRTPAPVARTTSGLALDPAVNAKIAAFERDALERGIASGRRALCVRFAPSPERAAAGTNINTVRERLGVVSEIVKVVPVSAPRSAEAPAALTFALLVLTRASDEDVAREVGVDVGSIDVVGEPGTSAPAPEPAVVPVPELHDEERDDVQRRGVVRVDVARLDEALERLAQLVISRGVLAREIAVLASRGTDVRGLQIVLREQSRQLRDMRAAVLQLRMVPASEVLERVPLVVRGLRKATGKAVRLEVDAGRTELDKAVAERLFPALVHLVRNAVDHAIEAPDERRRAGKPEEGLLRVTFETRGTGQVALVVQDDGRGIDAARVAARAGVEVPTTDAALLQLLCRPGLSTRDQVSTTSGRGIGMDVVRRIVVEELGGDLSMTTTPGRGTTIVARVPLTLSIVDVLTFECGSQRFVVPMASIDEIIEIDPTQVSAPPRTGAGSTIALIQRRGEAVPLVRLDRTLGLASADPERPKALVVRRDGDAIAFAIDRTLGQQEVVVRPLEDPLLRVPGVTGATDLGDGRPTLVVDLVALSRISGETSEVRT